MPFWMDAQGDGRPASQISLRRVVKRPEVFDGRANKFVMFGPPDYEENGGYEDHREYWMWEQYLSENLLYCLDEDRENLPAQLFVARLGPATYICDRIKRAIEELDPGMHRFVRMPLMCADQITPWPEPYWFWWCEHFIDCIVPDKRDGDPRRSHGIGWNADRGYIGFRHWVDPEKDNSVYLTTIWSGPDYVPVLSESSIEGAHAWREKSHLKRYTANGFFLSDALVSRIKQELATDGVRLIEISTSSLSARRP